MRQTRDKKLKKGQASLDDMMEIISPYLPKGNIVDDRIAREWKLSNENNHLSNGDSGIACEKI